MTVIVKIASHWAGFECFDGISSIVEVRDEAKTIMNKETPTDKTTSSVEGSVADTGSNEYNQIRENKDEGDGCTCGFQREQFQPFFNRAESEK